MYKLLNGTMCHKKGSANAGLGWQKMTIFPIKSDHRAPWFITKQGEKMMKNHHFTVKNDHCAKNGHKAKKEGLALNR